MSLGRNRSSIDRRRLLWKVSLFQCVVSGDGRDGAGFHLGLAGARSDCRGERGNQLRVRRHLIPRLDEEFHEIFVSGQVGPFMSADRGQEILLLAEPLMAGEELF